MNRAPLFAFCVLALSSAAAAHAESGMAALARSFVDDVDPTYNEYGEPASLTYDRDGVLHATARCGSFLAQIATRHYAGLTPDAVRRLTGSPSPTAEQWYNAVATSARDSVSGYSLYSSRILFMSTLGSSFFVTDYDLSSTTEPTGHVMIIGGGELIREVPKSDDGWVIPGTERWEFPVLDASENPHLDDTRDLADHGADDKGIGAGWIRLYVGKSLEVVAWQWGYRKGKIFWANPEDQRACPKGADCSLRSMPIGSFVRPQ